MIGRRLRRVFRTFRRGPTEPPTPSSDNVPSPPPNSSLAKDYGHRGQHFGPRFGKHNHTTSPDIGVYHRAESRPVNVPGSLSGALDQNTSLCSSSYHAQSLDTAHPALPPRDSTIMPRSTAAYVSGAPRSSHTSTIVSSHNGGISVPSDSVHFMNIAPQLSHPFRTPYPDTDRSGEVSTPGWFTGLFYDEGESVSSGSSYTSIFDSLEDHMADCHWGQQADSRADQRESTLSGPPLTSWFCFNDDSMESLFDTELILAERDRRDAKFGSVDHPHSNPVILELEEGDVDGQTDNKVTEAYNTDTTLLGNIVTHQATSLSGPTLPTFSTPALTGSIHIAPSSSVEPPKQQIHLHVPEPPGLPPLPFSPRPSLSSLSFRASDSMVDGLEGELGDSNRSRSELSYDWGPQHPTLAPALDGTTYLDTPVARDPPPKTTSILNLPPDMTALVHHVTLLNPPNHPRPLPSEFLAGFIQPDLVPYVIDTTSSNTAGQEHVTTSGSHLSCIRRGHLADGPIASDCSLSIAEACDQGHEAVGGCTVPPICTSAEDVFRIEPPGHLSGRLHASPLPAEELLVAATTATWVYAVSNPDNGAIRAEGRQQPDEYHEIMAIGTPGRGNNDGSRTSHLLHPARNLSSSSVDPKAVFKKPDIFRVSHLTGIGANRGICTLHSSDMPHPNLPSRRQPSPSLGIMLWIPSTGVELPWIMRLPMKHSRYVTTTPTLSSPPFPICSCQRKVRVVQRLQAIFLHVFSWDPGAFGSAFHFGYTPGSNQTPGNTYPRSEDGSGIWSGQGPGPSLNLLSSQGSESLGLASGFEGLFQAPGDSILGFPYDSNEGMVTLSLHSAPNPPVPLRLDILRGLLSEVFSAGVDAGLLLGNTSTIQWETAPNVFGCQQLNRIGGAQEQVISTLHHPTPSWSLGSSHGGDDWTSDLLLADLDTLVYGESGLFEFQSLPGAQAQPTVAASDTETPWDPVASSILGLWPEPPALHIDANETIGLQGSGGLLLGNDCSSNEGTDSAAEFDRSINPSHSALPASQTHPTQVATTSNIGCGSPQPGSPPEQGRSEYKHRCSQCGKRFRRRYILSDHIRAHENEKPYLCTEGCGKKYANRTGMMRHLKQVHLKTEDSQDVPEPSNEQTRGDIREQMSRAEPSNHNTRRGNTRFSHAFVPYDPSSARHKTRQRKQ